MKNKKALSDVIITVFIILVAILAVGLLYRFIRPQIAGAGEKVSCNLIGLQNSFSIEKACYNLEKEIVLQIKRQIDDLSIKSILVTFTGEQTQKFSIEESKCLDVRASGGEYGGPIFLPRKGAVSDYIFDTGKISSFDLASLEITYISEGKECVVRTQKEIAGNCM